VSSRKIGEAPIRVLRPDGTEIHGDLTAVRVYFWNAGKRAIKKENVLEPVYIRIDDRNASILDSRIIVASRPVIGASVTRDAQDPKHSLILNWSIMEKDDGVAVQISYEGDPYSPITVSGTIEGPAAIQKAILIGKEDTAPTKIALITGHFALLVFAGLILAGFLRYRHDRSQIYGFILLGIFVLVMLGFAIYADVQYSRQTSVVVPSTLFGAGSR
jgi:hypothetical protein